MIRCSECNALVSPTADFCLQCYSPVDKPAVTELQRDEPVLSMSLGDEEGQFDSDENTVTESLVTNPNSQQLNPSRQQTNPAPQQTNPAQRQQRSNQPPAKNVLKNSDPLKKQSRISLPVPPEKFIDHITPPPPPPPPVAKTSADSVPPPVPTQLNMTPSKASSDEGDEIVSGEGTVTEDGDVIVQSKNNPMFFTVNGQLKWRCQVCSHLEDIDTFICSSCGTRMGGDGRKHESFLVRNAKLISWAVLGIVVAIAVIGGLIILSNFM